MIDNPIKELLYSLGTNTQVITLEYLNRVSDILLKYNVNLQTYGNVFRFLEYLEEKGCIRIDKDNNKDVFILTGLYNYGKNIK